MDFARPFSYVFEDPDWVRKLLLNALIGLIPIVGQLYLLGWMLDIARRVANGEDPVWLPEINFGAFLGEGFKALILGFIYSIPVFILVAPIAILPVLGEAVGMDYDTIGTISMITSVCCSGIILLYSIVLGLAMPAAQLNMVMQGSLGAGLRFGEVLGLVRAAPMAYLMVLVGSIAAGLLASLVGGIACGIGIIFTMAYYQAVMGHFSGQAYRIARGAV